MLGFTYNWENPDTHYQNGIDAHLDWAASQFFSEQLHAGLVGYFYQQLTGDSGRAVLGDFKSRFPRIGPQIGFLPGGREKWYVNLKGYYEFDARTGRRVERVGDAGASARIREEMSTPVSNQSEESTVMKLTRKQSLIAAALAGGLALTSVHAQTTPKPAAGIPPALTTPDKVETRIGTLDFKDGMPSKQIPYPNMGVWVGWTPET